ncbi:hypothetical protein [Cesiribacter andamanensis]|uniref:Uncharacterized protein n=1 Tax=Cesiribacter andamanensis AMV16 TaxID=1279009 RepID=M7N1T8_9BACT|nr:hypothetical protein [Cesiribacter andamanensis]EMR02648.1 hypothetical protein ADICEAN_02187 [Cesiribacter andamanensis AMV16]
MDLKQVFGTILTLLGIVILLVAVMAIIGGGANFMGISLGIWQGAVVALLGLVFFLTGIGLIKRTPSKPR